jgi:ubiquinol-cytochrome c reductase cytochrome c1 subunit
MKRFLALVLAALSFASAAVADEGGPAWDRFPVERVTNEAALQTGAKLFVNYCLNCHSASYMRYNRLHDIGLTDTQIQKNLIFTSDTSGKPTPVGELMKVSMDPKQAEEWFGVVPPDLSVIARSRAGEKGSGADYLYTYLRSFYADPTRPTGWNNRVFPNVGMPHVLWQLQGTQVPVYGEQEGEDGKKEQVMTGLQLATPGTLSRAEYNEQVADLVAYLQWMGEPAQDFRVRLGVWVVLFLFLFTIITWRLNASFWKDVK